jgi:CBS domain containing-hemolysin-like protein
MWITCIISWPLAKLLDCLLGEHKFQRYDNDQLKKLVMLHSVNALKKVEEHIEDGITGITSDQARIVEGALSYQTVKCEEIMTNIKKVSLTLEMDTVLTSKLLIEIRDIGFSRIPIIHNGDINKIVGILLTKSLIGLDISQGKTVGQFYTERAIQIKVPLYLDKQCNLSRVVNSFQKGHTHMAVVCDHTSSAKKLRDFADKEHNRMNKREREQEEIFFDTSSSKGGSNKDPGMFGVEQLDQVDEIVGILTLENIIERVLLTDIHDEKDRDTALKNLKRQASVNYRNTNLEQPERKLSMESYMLSAGSQVEGQQVFKSKFVQSYFNHLYDDIKHSIV